MAVTCLLVAAMPVRAELHVVILQGLAGDETYAAEFDRQVAAVEEAAGSVTRPGLVRVFTGADATRDAVGAHFQALATSLSAEDSVAVYLIGHGSYDDVEYKFNLPGPDLSAADIAALLDALPTGHQLLVNTSSASGAMLETLQKDGRVLITATRSGVERHATRFGTHFAAALSSDSADLDKNRMVSAEEAFRYAERRVADFFEGDNRLSTEHARLQGEQAGRITLARLDTPRMAVVDDELRGLLAERDALNAEVESLRQSRSGMEPQDYQARLLEKMLELARLEDRIEARQQALIDSD